MSFFALHGISVQRLRNAIGRVLSQRTFHAQKCQCVCVNRAAPTPLPPYGQVSHLRASTYDVVAQQATTPYKPGKRIKSG